MAAAPGPAYLTLTRSFIVVEWIVQTISVLFVTLCLYGESGRIVSSPFVNLLPLTAVTLCSTAVPWLPAPQMNLSVVPFLTVSFLGLKKLSPSWTVLVDALAAGGSSAADAVTATAAATSRAARARTAMSVRRWGGYVRVVRGVQYG